MFVFDGCLKKLNEYMADKAYVNGFQMSRNDAALLMSIMCQEIPEEFVHVRRWMKHVQSFTMAELKQLTGDVTVVKCPCGDKKCEQPCEKKEEKVEEAAADMFASSESEEDEEAKARAEKTRKAMAEAKAAGKKAKKVDRSMLVIHIKPWEDTTDMNAILATLPEKVQMEGLTWGKAELQDGPFNIKYIAVACIIVDDLCSSDELTEKIIEAYGDEVIQNADVVVFNKCE